MTCADTIFIAKIKKNRFYLSGMSEAPKIALLTSGGDAPGMNAAIRSVVRSASYYNYQVLGVWRGLAGLVDGDFIEMDSLSVSNIIQKGGTILKSSRSDEFHKPEGRAKAARNLREAGVEGLIVIGGNGSFNGCKVFTEEHHFPTIGIPGTIDNDLAGTDYTLGYDTAVNTALLAVDQIRDTADSHNRLFFIEVMGRDAGFIALNVGLGGGAEGILIPETSQDFDHAVKNLQEGFKREKTSSIIIVAEGDEEGGAFDIVKQMKPHIPQFEYRVSILGHIQRGGRPLAMDRILGSRFGFAAVRGLMEGRTKQMVGVVNHEDTFTDFGECLSHSKSIDQGLVSLAEILSS